MCDEGSIFPRDELESYLDKIDDLVEEGKLEHKPIREQRTFIKRNQDQFVVLQGPPGTGKTFTLAHALLARSLALMKQRRMARVLLVAPSNTAVDATMRKCANFLSVLSDSEEFQDFGNLEIKRITSQTDREFDQDNIESINYRTEEEKLEEMERVLESQTGLNREGHILFATPTGTYKLINEIFEDSTESVFDLLAVDEASMMTAPKFLKSGAPSTSNSQILICGDHRQMPPVQKHDWDGEDRRTVEEIVPYLSIMDFFRMMSQEDSFGAEEFEEMDIPEEKQIPIDRLSKTHRCHRVLTELLRRLIYEEDGIPLESDREGVLEVENSGNDGLNTILNPSAPVTLVVHKEKESQQANKFEETLIKEILEGIENRSERTGIVTPHNAQRGRMENSFRDIENTTVNTVEKFQGEERDAIIFATTESDPDYIRKASEFILSPHRLNVSLSRMEKKLIIIASESLINFIPSDSEQYEDARLWKKLLREMKNNGGEEPNWTGTIEDLLGRDLENVDSEKGVEVFNVEEIEE